MDLRCNLLLCLISGIVLIIEAEDPNSNKNGYQAEPYQVNPPGLEEERRKLLYPFDVSDYVTDIGVARPIHDVPLIFRLPFFGFNYNYMLIHKDGYITFNKGLVRYDFPIKFPIHISDPLREEDPSLIAPWLSQQDIPKDIPAAGVYFRIVDLQKESNATLRERILRDFREGMIGANQFTAKYAMIVTWKNVTFANRQSNRPVKTNTYQAVLATDELTTYAMLNYEWISWITHMDNYEGMKGPQPYVGFNAGNMTRSFEFRPYSQHPFINTLADRGFANGVKGRHMFKIDEEIYSGSCVESSIDPNWNDRPLSFFPRYGSMLGGTLFNITGPCIPKDRKTITVKFDYKNVECVVRDENHATCVSPPLMYHGYIDISTGLDDKSFFHHGRFYILPPDSPEGDLLLKNDRELEPEMLEVSWNPSVSWNQTSQVKFHLWGYRETSGYPNLTYITELASGGIKLNYGKHRFDVQQFQNKDDRGKTDLTFGFISMNLSDTNALESPVFWSRPMPLAWYFKPQWEKEYGTIDLWRERQCLNWHVRDVRRNRFDHTIPRCPCTIEQAQIDRGRFQPDTSCNHVIRDCETFHRGAYTCFNSATTALGGAGQTCCYDNEGELVQTVDTMYGGRPSRAFKDGKHPYRIPMMVPSLSHWVHDVMPFFFCCKWHPEQDNSDTCEKFKSLRTSQDCSSYSHPGVGSVFGDPHFLTFDRVNYTFNGKGEFVLTRVEEKYHRMDIQARFEQIPKRHRLDPNINGTVLTAIVARDNLSSVVEFRLRPAAASVRYRFYVIVDREYISFSDKPFQSRTFRGVSLYQEMGTTNMSHIVATFDSGVGVEVKSRNGYMSANVFLPTSFKGRTRGLLGNWSDIEKDDFATPDGTVLVTSNATIRQIHKAFGIRWRLDEENKENIGESLFFHDGVPFAGYDDPSFEPEFEQPPRIPENFTNFQMVAVCGTSMTCRYDFIVTGDQELAKTTMVQEREADSLAAMTRKQVIRCPALPRPHNGRKSDTRRGVGSEVHFTCDEGYELYGAQTKICTPNGQWSWGLDTECIADDRRR